MAERKAQNKYYPPDYDPEYGSLNRFVHYSKQPDLARKKRSEGDGFKVIRFEMPFNLWCGGCNGHIGRGVRFNAHRRTVGFYHSTPILDFRMKCPECRQHWFTIRADPETSEYIVTEGARRKHEEWSDEAVEGKKGLAKEERLELQDNPFAKLEHQVKDERALKAAIPHLQRLHDAKNRIGEDDFSSNSQARRLFRERKRRDKEDSIHARLGLSSAFELPKEEHEDDVDEARRLFPKKRKGLGKSSNDPIVDVQAVEPGQDTYGAAMTSRAVVVPSRKLPAHLRKHLRERAPGLLQRK